MKEFFTSVRSSLVTVFRARLWPIIAGLAFVFSLLLVGLTVTSSAAAIEAGTNSGRMALSFIVYLVLVAAMIGVPAVLAGTRDELGRLSFLRTFAIALVVGLSFIVVALPAMFWAVASTGVGTEIWLPVIGTAKLEVWVVAALTALAFSNLRRDGAATVTAFALIAGLAVGPLLVLLITSFAPGVEQNISHRYIDYGKGNEQLDPVTGFPTNPTCLPADDEKKVVARYDLVWPALELNPVVLVSASIPPTVSGFTVSAGGGVMQSVAPTDLFGTVDLAVRAMQLTPETTLVVDECANLAKYGTPYPSNSPGSADPEFVIANSTSGWSVGLIGQAAYLAVASAALVAIGRRSKQ
jgi:hypothetical protein